MKTHMKGSIYDLCEQNGIKFNRVGDFNVFKKGSVVVEVPFTFPYDYAISILTRYFPELGQQKLF